jgi:hypothetical protein
MLVKIRNLRRFPDGHPAAQHVTIFNAAENDHMLAINIALGFRPAGSGSGRWPRSASPPGMRPAGRPAERGQIGGPSP